ncbi:hypothetical protein SprV_0401510600 [Sparganum proliferum]
MRRCAAAGWARERALKAQRNESLLASDPSRILHEGGGHLISCPNFNTRTNEAVLFCAKPSRSKAANRNAGEQPKCCLQLFAYVVRRLATVNVGWRGKKAFATFLKSSK